jgi:Zn-dependent membrane protease YugP
MQMAQEILDREGIRDVRIEPVRGFLGDHYDSRSKVLRLSPEVYHGHSVASAGVAAHEVGHWKKRHVLKRIIMTEVMALCGIMIAYRLLKGPQLPNLLTFILVDFAANSIMAKVFTVWYNI